MSFIPVSQVLTFSPLFLQLNVKRVVKSSELLQLGVQLSNLCMWVEMVTREELMVVRAMWKRGGTPAACHRAHGTGGPAPLQLPHHGAQLQHQGVALLQQPQVLLNQLLHLVLLHLKSLDCLSQLCSKTLIVKDLETLGHVSKYFEIFYETNRFFSELLLPGVNSGRQLSPLSHAAVQVCLQL